MRRGGVYYLRARVPRDLLLKVRRREIWKSLGERNAAAARTLAAKARLCLFELFDHIRNEPLITDTEIQHGIRDFYRNELALDAAIRRSPRPLSGTDADFHVWMLSELQTELKDHLTRGEFVLVEDEARALLERRGISPKAAGPRYRELLQGIMRAKLEATRVELDRWRGDWTNEKPRDPLLRGVLKESPEAATSAPTTSESAAITPPPKVDPRRLRSGKTVLEVLEKFLKERGTDRLGYEDEFRQSISWFIDHFGHSRTIDSFTWAELADYAELLREVPARWKLRYPEATMVEAIKRNKTDGYPLLSIKTINNNRLGHLATLFRWALKKRYIAVNPTEGVKVDAPKKKAAAKPRVNFSIPDLQTIFNAPLFVGCESYSSWKKPGAYQVRDHRFWLPLIGLFSGARLGELAQLLVTDFFIEEGAWFYRVTDESCAEDGPEKRVKSSESRRVVPVHPELLKIGLIDFVLDQKRKGCDRIFPECNRAKNGKFDPFSKHFARFRKSIGIADSRKVFHSLRHNMEDAMREAELQDSIRYRIAGRALPHSSTIYGSGDSPKIRRALHDAMRKIEFEGLDLSHLYGAYRATA